MDDRGTLCTCFFLRGADTLGRAVRLAGAALGLVLRAPTVPGAGGAVVDAERVGNGAPYAPTRAPAATFPPIARTTTATTRTARSRDHIERFSERYRPGCSHFPWH
jgi:hypothetical protein